MQRRPGPQQLPCSGIISSILRILMYMLRTWESRWLGRLWEIWNWCVRWTIIGIQVSAACSLKCSLQDLIAICFPKMAVFTVPLIAACFIIWSDLETAHICRSTRKLPKRAYFWDLLCGGNEAALLLRLHFPSYMAAPTHIFRIAEWQYTGDSWFQL